MLTVYLVEHIAYLLLCQPFCVKDSCESIAFLLLIAKYGQNLRMEVAVSVARYAEFKFTALTIGRARTVAVTLVTRIIS